MEGEGGEVGSVTCLILLESQSSVVPQSRSQGKRAGQNIPYNSVTALAHGSICPIEAGSCGLSTFQRQREEMMWVEEQRDTPSPAGG